MGARVDDTGAPVLLEAQDRTRRDQLMVRRGMAARRQARTRRSGGTFLQASIAAQPARATQAEETDWRQIARVYDVLAQAAPGAIVEVHRAVAHGRAFDPDAGLAVLEQVDARQLEHALEPAGAGLLTASSTKWLTSAEPSL